MALQRGLKDQPRMLAHGVKLNFWPVSLYRPQGRAVVHQQGGRVHGVECDAVRVGLHKAL